MIEPYVIELPLWFQLVGSAACFKMLLWMGDFSDNAVKDCGWVGHSGDET